MLVRYAEPDISILTLNYAANFDALLMYLLGNGCQCMYTKSTDRTDSQFYSYYWTVVFDGVAPSLALSVLRDDQLHFSSYMSMP